MVFREKYINSITFFIGLLLMQSCCYLPLVDCFPLITDIKVNHEIDKDIFYSIRAWKGEDRRKKDITLHIEFGILISNRNEINFKKSKISYLNTTGDKFHSNLLNAWTGKNEDSLMIKHYHNIFENFSENLPITVNLDSVAIVQNGTINYMDLQLELEE